ncbi:dCTP pyrophosphatase [Salix suchowensis]|nr:dCTP pyrophosphatase [Salix suchowensis]
MEETEEISVAEEKVVDISLKDLAEKLEEFARARDWEKYHSPRNLLLAMRRGGQGVARLGGIDKEHLAEELSDVLLYLIRLSDICGIDLGEAATKKL